MTYVEHSDGLERVRRNSLNAIRAERFSYGTLAADE